MDLNEYKLKVSLMTVKTVWEPELFLNLRGRIDGKRYEKDVCDAYIEKMISRTLSRESKILKKVIIFENKYRVRIAELEFSKNSLNQDKENTDKHYIRTISDDATELDTVKMKRSNRKIKGESDEISGKINNTQKELSRLYEILKTIQEAVGQYHHKLKNRLYAKIDSYIYGIRKYKSDYVMTAVYSNEVYDLYLQNILQGRG